MAMICHARTGSCCQRVGSTSGCGERQTHRLHRISTQRRIKVVCAYQAQPEPEPEPDPQPQPQPQPPPLVLATTQDLEVVMLRVQASLAKQDTVSAERFAEVAERFAEVRAAIAKLDTNMEAAITKLDTKMEAAITKLDTKMEAAIAKLDTKLETGLARLQVVIIGVVVLASILSGSKELLSFVPK